MSLLLRLLTVTQSTLWQGDEVVYTISAPYMTDANGEKSEAVTLTVEKNKNGKLRLVISADENWLRAEDRAYPVVVDPIVETEREKESIDAVMIAEPAELPAVITPPLTDATEELEDVHVTV